MPLFEVQWGQHTKEKQYPQRSPSPSVCSPSINIRQRPLAQACKWWGRAAFRMRKWDQTKIYPFPCLHGAADKPRQRANLGGQHLIRPLPQLVPCWAAAVWTESQCNLRPWQERKGYHGQIRLSVANASLTACLNLNNLLAQLATGSDPSTCCIGPADSSLAVACALIYYLHLLLNSNVHLKKINKPKEIDIHLIILNFELVNIYHFLLL